MNKQYKVGDIVKSKGSQAGMIAFIHLASAINDEPELVIDFGDTWWAEYIEDIKLATPKQKEKFLAKYEQGFQSVKSEGCTPSLQALRKQIEGLRKGITQTFPPHAGDGMIDLSSDFDHGYNQAIQDVLNINGGGDD